MRAKRARVLRQELLATGAKVTKAMERNRKRLHHRPDAAISVHAFQGHGQRTYKRVHVTNTNLLHIKAAKYQEEIKRRRNAQRRLKRGASKK